MPGHADAHAARRVLEAFFPVRPVARWHLPGILPGVILTFLGIVDATLKQEHSAQKLRRWRVRVSAPLYVRGWRAPNNAQCAQRPTPNRKSGNTQLQEAPSCFEAEEMEEDRAH